MSYKSEKAKNLFASGFNCAQAVLGAFCCEYGLENETAFKVACGLGSGARSGELCGAVSGAVLVIGLKYGTSVSTGKELCNSKTEEFIKLFKENNKSIVCKDILGCDIATKQGREKAVEGKLFSTICSDMVESAVLTLESLGL